MIGITTLLLYVECADDDETLVWYQGALLTAAQRDERAQIHRELADIVEHADLDDTLDWGRAVRSGDRLLVEVDVSRSGAAAPVGVRTEAGAPAPGATHPLTATIVVSVARPDTAWATEAAQEVAALMREQGFDIAVDQLVQAFAEGWGRKPPPGTWWEKRGLAAAGAALVVALCWVLNAVRVRRHRSAETPADSLPARAKALLSKGQR